MTKDFLGTLRQGELLERALTSLPTGLFICDKEGIVRFINEAYARYLGLTPEQAVGKLITDLIPDSRIPAVLASGQSELGARRRFHHARKETNILVNRLPLRDADGEIMGALSMTILDTPEQLQELLRRVEVLGKQVNSYAKRIKSALAANYTVDSILGESPAISTFKAYLLRYARTDAPVLILGATGTGKELAASAIHAASNRPEGPFVGINCAAIPKELFESEIFGYVPGAFSGAHREGKIGQIELADKGTLFLDEVGDLPLHAQVKLLRVLEERKVCRLGSSQPRCVDFRLVAATNRDLQSMVRAGTFREDLYYRINPMTLQLPPLCERKEDIPLLARDMLIRMNAESVRISDDVRNVFMRYSWPGNIRELRNVLVRALSLCQNRLITVADLPRELVQHSLCPVEKEGNIPTLQHLLEGSEAHVLLTTLQEQNWNVARSARALGISRASMYEKMKKLGIRRPAREESGEPG